MKIQIIVSNGSTMQELKETIPVEWIGYSPAIWQTFTQEEKEGRVKQYLIKQWYVNFEEWEG